MYTVSETFLRTILEQCQESPGKKERDQPESQNQRSNMRVFTV